MRKLSYSSVIPVCAIIVFTSALFAYTTRMRAPWFGAAPQSFDTWLSTSVLLWLKNWLNDGPTHLWFAYFWDPNSIEMSTLDSRSIYVSYPPGCVIPLYIFCKAFGIAPSIATVMTSSLINQYIAALFLSLFAYMFTLKAGGSRADAIILAIIPAGALTLLPSPASQFQMAYLHVAVLAPYVLTIFLEFIRDSASHRNRKIISIALSLILFYGTLCDWLFVFLAFCIFIKRVFTFDFGSFRAGNIRRDIARFVRYSVVFWLPSLIAVGLFAAMLNHFNQFTELASRFDERASVNSGRFLTFTFNSFFWTLHIPSSPLQKPVF
jgi:hypothetical protein